MDQSNNINPNTGNPANLILNTNADFLADDNTITINSITEDTLTFTTGNTIASGAFLSYGLIDECSGATTQVTISSWCQHTTPNPVNKDFYLYTKNLYTVNFLNATYTKDKPKGSITFDGGKGDSDSTFTTSNGVVLQGEVYLIPNSVSLIAGDATIVSATSSTITIQTNEAFTTEQFVIEYSLQNECGVILTWNHSGNMNPYPPDTYIKDTLFHGEETKTLNMNITVDSSYMSGRSFAIIGGGTLDDSCGAGSSTCSLQTTIDGGIPSISNSIIYRCFLFVNNTLYYKPVTDVIVSNFLTPIANSDTTNTIGFLPLFDIYDSFWVNILNITTGYIEVTSVNIVDQVVSNYSGPCTGSMSGFLAAIRYI